MAAAADAFESGLAFAPDDPRIAISAARARLRAGDPTRARELGARVAETAPKSPALERLLAKLALEPGDAGDAARHYREALQLAPEQLDAANELAWLLATTGDARVRDPEESIRLARGVVAAKPEPDPNTLDTLAAAYASAGRFAEAVDTAARAPALAEQRGDARVLESIEQRLALYRGGRAYVEASDSAGG